MDAGHKAGIWVGLCGEMAADPALAVLLIGLGVDELSVSSVAVRLRTSMSRKAIRGEEKSNETVRSFQKSG